MLYSLQFSELIREAAVPLTQSLNTIEACFSLTSQSRVDSREALLPEVLPESGHLPSILQLCAALSLQLGDGEKSENGHISFVVF